MTAPEKETPMPCHSCGSKKLEPFSGWLTRCQNCGFVASTKLWNIRTRPVPSGLVSATEDALERGRKLAEHVHEAVDYWEEDPTSQHASRESLQTALAMAEFEANEFTLSVAKLRALAGKEKP